MKYVILGASIAGTTAAEELRHIDSECEITLVTKEAYPLYSRITVSAYAGGIVSKDNLILKKVEHLEEKKITFLSQKEAIGINLNKRAVSFQDNTTITYDKLLIATGGVPNKLDLPGGNADGIFTMHSLDDGTQIRDYAQGKKKAIVSGGAFIGIDFINTFINLGLEVDYLIRGSSFLHNILDADAAMLIHDILNKKGVHIRLNEEILEFLKDENGKVKGVRTNKGELECDIVGLGIGINRIFNFIKSSGLKYNKGIIANEYLQTLNPNVFVAGDVAEYFNTLQNGYSINGDWASARNMGICAAKNMAGEYCIYNQIAINTINLFGVNISLIGNTTQKDMKSYKSIEGSTFRQIFLIDGEIVGGVAIGNPQYTMKVKTAIINGTHPTSIDI